MSDFDYSTSPDFNISRLFPFFKFSKVVVRVLFGQGLHSSSNRIDSGSL